MKRVYMIASVIMLAGCQNDEHIISKAFQVYESVVARYRDLMRAETDVEIQKLGRLLGTKVHLNVAHGMWNSFMGRGYLYYSESCPLHRLRYFLNGDLDNINRSIFQLESRALTSLPIYQKLKFACENLNYVLEVIVQSDAYLEEARFIESQSLQKAQVDAMNAQTAAYLSAPRVIKEEVIVTREPNKKTRKVVEEIHADKDIDNIVV